ncbi:YhcN/YlaJ family sporulation lipoprotein [Schinkia azotoformans]|uniref:Sporulation lipoprotein YhcN/YlaJ-like protein n=1 Tax=Schinkia azotoformans LMG 9581 TaxID=1131731 RepID=K6CAK8_SCHAZ|nr:YhcN/YlaJ family sporulation lipoprotein [Schinkia azotoformans]EKN68160.1 hypothetical protein BAZO_05355 [Schinkia azotoformans LMG 9581]MEC1639677.1 YhcN/YlaJ family sporulation lipoprotein [Schinkia azotoformans]MEC1722482.1 YhcN/YlaJ family sporulation lipoprotein [Schinkia azotoformans]MEC1946977.1 YhcN/YlaJ family sporulation lipoprotein [Schinkia azotoformans]MED4350863.1 YhcN/YlaJ family sporulation lipoprotein [Schinkia azotoformans]
MRPKIMFISLIFLAGLVGCNINNNNAGEDAQPRMGDNVGQVTSPGNGTNTTNMTNTTNLGQQYDDPYNHNYNGSYSGEQGTQISNDVRSAQRVASRASEAAEDIAGVNRAVSVVQGADIVVAIDVNQKGDEQGLEKKVQQVIAKNEQGYNVYVTSDPDIKERVHTLFTNMNNVKTSFVSKGIGEIIYDIGHADGRR